MHTLKVPSNISFIESMQRFMFGMLSPEITSSHLVTRRGRFLFGISIKSIPLGTFRDKPLIIVQEILAALFQRQVSLRFPPEEISPQVKT